MTSTRPYLIRAFYEWIVDNLLTPYFLVNATMEHVDVPSQYIEDGKIVLNLSPSAVENLQITNQVVEFDASFSGELLHIYVPIRAVEAVYAKENGRGMVFSIEEEEESDVPPLPPKRTLTGKPHLKVVK